MLLAIFCVSAWATSFVGVGYGLLHFDPVALAFGRFATAGLCGALWLILKRPSLPSAKDFTKLAFCGLIGIALYAICLNYAQTHISAGLASFITGINPLVTLILAVIFLKEQAGKYLLIGTIISLIGVLLISISRGGVKSVDLYVLLVVFAATCGAIAMIVQKSMLARMDPVTQSAWVIIFGAITLTPFSGIAYEQFINAPVKQQLNVLYLGVVPGFLAYSAFTLYIKHVGAARASTIVFAVPFFASLIGYFVLEQSLTRLGFIGGVIALIGVALARIKSNA